MLSVTDIISEKECVISLEIFYDTLGNPIQVYFELTKRVVELDPEGIIQSYWKGAIASFHEV